MAATERLTPQIFRPDVDLDATATLPMAPVRLRLARPTRSSKPRRQGEEFDSEEFYATNVLPYDGEPRLVAETTGLQQLRVRARRLRGLVAVILAPLTLLAAFNIGRATASPPAAPAQEAIPTIMQASLPSPPLSSVPLPASPPASAPPATATATAPALAPKPVKRRRAPARVPVTREQAPSPASSALPTTRENPGDNVLNGD